MKLSDLKTPPGATRRPKRLGLGESSGHGKTSTRGHKGQRARSGHGIPLGFEGGQMPLIRRVPKRGFTHIRPISAEIVNVRQLNRFPDKAVVDPATLEEAGLIRSREHRVTILGEGELSKALTVWAHRFSQSALEKIHQAGGKTEVMDAGSARQQL